jgi:2-oxo-3-hexenedioate decarboxylase
LSDAPEFLYIIGPRHADSCRGLFSSLRQDWIRAMTDKPAMQTDKIAEELLAVLGTGKQVTPFSSRHAGFGMAEAYDVVAKLHGLRKSRGEKPVGRKIGFTNRGIWQAYGVSGPIWNYMYDTTVGDLAAADSFALNGFPQLQIEPEIALHLAKAPRAGMSEPELMDCIDWVAHGFEMVQSVFPNWKFSGADATAAYAMHAGLLLSDKHPVSQDRKRWREMLPTFTVTLNGSDGTKRVGSGRNVLDGPLAALQFLVEEIARYPGNEPLGAGEIVTTGTLTDAMPVAADQVWTTEIDGIDIKGISVRFR